MRAYPGRFGVILANAVAGCATAPATLSPSPPSTSAPTTAQPILRPTLAPTATPIPTGVVGAIETRPPLLPTPPGWTDPVTVISGPCSSLDAQVDAAGGYHIVATCGDALVYAFSANGKTWSTT